MENSDKNINLLYNIEFSDSGDLTLFKSIQSKIENAIPVDRVEWKRSYGRATAKNIKLEATFKSFESCKSQLENYNTQNFSIIDPVLNLYICECNVSYLS